MPRQRTAEENRDYMAAYRARQKSPDPIATVPRPDPVEKAGSDLEHRLLRQRADRRKWSSPFTDGLPDWPELIGGMPQQRRDAILSRPTIRTARWA